MANFKTHISFGIAAGVLSALALSGMVAAQAPGFLITIFVVAILGSVLPDMDSDSSVPFNVAFGSLTIVVSSLVFNHFYKVSPRDFQQIIGWTAGTAVLVWGVVGYIFKKFTYHRGIAHSVPAAILAGLCTFFVATRLSFTEEDAFILSVAMSVGYSVHLVLDEIWAMVNFNGRLFVPNRSFGTALKFFSHDRLVNIMIYSAICVLIYSNYSQFVILAQGFIISLRQ